VDLSPGRQKAAFIGIVIALAALGYYLVVPALTHSRGAGRAASPPSHSATAPTAPVAASQSAASPAATASDAATGPVNIHAWLPFTQQDLAAAASVTMRFSIDYDTYTYTESAARYVGTMGSLITGELAATLQSAYSTPGVAKLRTGQKQVSTGTALIDSLRAFGPSSLTFIVTAGQRLVSSRGTTSGSTQYAVTVTGSGSSWQVNDIELESAGDT
jgi:hypothetical protein